jgi:signal transduction histidine kinase
VLSLSTVALASSEHLGRLIDDILDMEKIQSGKMQLSIERLDLSALAERAVELYRIGAQVHEVRLALAAAPDLAAVRGDRDRLHQVFANLISNAVKHSPAGAAVEIAVARTEERMRVTVRDRGPGVPPEFRPRLFEKFSQAGGRNASSRGGTGLGLAITKAIVEAHGGAIGHEDAEGGGARFWFELPCAGAAQDKDQRHPSVEANQGVAI